jgi:hypothetical protein
MLLFRTFGGRGWVGRLPIEKGIFGRYGDRKFDRRPRVGGKFYLTLIKVSLKLMPYPSGVSAMSGPAPPSTNPSTPAVPANSARAAPHRAAHAAGQSVRHAGHRAGAPPWVRKAKRAAERSERAETSNPWEIGPFPTTARSGGNPAETGGNPGQRLCPANCPQFPCLTFGVHPKALIGRSLAEIAETPRAGPGLSLGAISVASTAAPRRQERSLGAAARTVDPAPLPCDSSLSRSLQSQAHGVVARPLFFAG